MSEAVDGQPAVENNNAPPMLPHLQQQQQQNEHANIDYDQEARKLEEKAVRFLAKQAHPVIIPSFASWFKFSEVHEIEKRMLPDFFDDSSRFKTEKGYKDVRNFMINTYRLSPFEYLTVTAVRRNIAMDVASIVRIHAFLEQWGLINYQIDPRSKPSLLGPSFTGHFQIVLDTPQGLKPFVPAEVITETETPEVEESNNDAAETTQEKTEAKTVTRIVPPEKFPVNLSLRKNIYDNGQDFNSLQTNSQQSRQIHKTYICHTCGNDAVGIRYHNLRSRDTNLCSRCFQEGHFSAHFQSSDFIRLENNVNTRKQWSDQEVLLLLEGVEMYEDDWEKIVEHVGGSKSLEECVEKFLVLPIEDRYIDEVVTAPAKEAVAKKNIVDTKDAVDAAIKALINGTNDKILNENIPEKADSISQKYLEEAQLVVQDLIKLTVEKVDLKFKQLDSLETTLNQEREKYVKEADKLLNEKLSLSKQITELNDEMAKLNVSKKLVLLSEQATTGIKLVEKDEEAQSKERKAKRMEELQSISHVEPQLYKPWSLS